MGLFAMPVRELPCRVVVPRRENVSLRLCGARERPQTIALCVSAQFALRTELDRKAERAVDRALPCRPIYQRLHYALCGCDALNYDSECEAWNSGFPSVTAGGEHDRERDASSLSRSLSRKTRSYGD